MAPNRRRASSAASLTTTPVFPWSKQQLHISGPFFPRKYLAATTAFSKNQICTFYLFGGASETSLHNDLVAVDPTSLTTQYLYPTSMNPASTPSPRRGHSMAHMQGHLYVFGGTDHTGQASDDALYVYDIANNMWTRPNLQSQSPQCRHMHSSSVVGSKMYIFGGMTHGYYLNDVVIFDGAYLHNQPAWQFLQPANEPPPGRTGHSAVVHQDKIYIFGGTDGVKVFDDMWCYDTRNNSWQCILGAGYVPQSRYGHSACIVQDVMYVFGGRGGTGQGLNDLFAYRFQANRWFTFQKMGPAPSARAGSCLVPCGTKIIVFGGSDSDDAPSVVSCLDTAKIRYPPDPPPVRNSRSNPQLNTEVSRSAQPRTSSVPSFAGFPKAMKRLTNSILPSRIGFGQQQPQSSGNSQRRESVTEKPREIQSRPAPQAIDQRPTMVPQEIEQNRPQPSLPSSFRISAFGPPQTSPGMISQQRLESVMELPVVEIQPKTVPQDVRPPQFPFPGPPAGNPQPVRSICAETLPPPPQFPPPPMMTAQVPDPRTQNPSVSQIPTRTPPQRNDSLKVASNLLKEELDAKTTELETLKNKMNWLSAEFYSARSSTGSEEKEGDMNTWSDQDGEKGAISAVMLKLRKELRDAKAMITQTSAAQTQRLKESEQIRTAALCEAAYQKSRAEAFAESNREAFLDLDTERTRTLETRLVDVLKLQEKQTIELESLRSQTLKHIDVARHADAARRGAEERAERAQKIQNEAERIRTELQERLRVAEAKVAEFAIGDVQGTLKRNEDLERSLVEQGSALALAAQILEGANKRADEAEVKAESAQTSNFQLQQECGVMRTRLAELESENTSLKAYATEAKSTLIKLKERSESESTLLSTIQSWKSNESLSRSNSVESDASTDTLRRKIEEDRARHESILLAEKRLRESAEKRIRELGVMYERARDEALSMRDECRRRAEEISVTRMEGESIALQLKETFSALQVVTMQTENGVSVKDLAVGSLGTSEDHTAFREKIAALERKSAKTEEECREMETLHAEAQEELRILTERNLQLESVIHSLSSQNSSSSPDVLKARAEEAERQLEATKTSLQAKASRLENDTYKAIQMVKSSDSKLSLMQSQLEEARLAAKKSEKLKMIAESEAELAREKYETAVAGTTTTSMNSQPGESTTLNKEREAWQSTKQVLEKRISMLTEMHADTRDDASARELEAANDALEQLTSELALALEKRDALELRVEEMEQEIIKVKSSDRAHYQRGMQSEKAASQLASRMAALSQEIAEAKDRVEELTHENQTLLAEIGKLDQNRSLQNQEITRVNQRFEELVRDHQKLLAVLGEMETKLEAADSDSQTKEQLEEMTREHRKLLAELEAMETRLEESDRILEDSQIQASEEIAQGKEQIERLTRELEEMEAKLETADRGHLDPQSHAREIARANAQVEEMNQIHETLLEELENMEIKLEAADQSHADSQARTTEELAECKSRIEELSREHEELLVQLDEVEAKLETADQRLAESQRTAAEEIAQANARIEALSLERQQLDVGSQTRATEELAECKLRIEDLTREHQELLIQLEKTETNLEIADQSLADSQAKAAEEIAQANARIEELALEREKLLADVDAMERELESKDRGLTDAESQANNLLTVQAQLALAAEKLSESDQRYEEATRVIRETEEELESLRQEHLEVSEAAERLKVQVAELMEEQEISTEKSAELQETLRQEHRDALHVVEELEQQVATFSEQQEISAQLIQETEGKLDLLREEHREALEEAATLREQVAHLIEGQETSTRLIQEAEAELEALREELREESEGAAALAQNVADLTEEQENLNRVIQEAEEKLELLREEYRERLEGTAELEQQVADLLEERESSARVIQETEEKLQTLQEEHRGVLEGSEGLEQKIAGLLEGKAVMTQLIQDTEVQLESLRKEYQEAKEEAEALKRQIAEISDDQAQKTSQLQSTISDLESQLAESKAAADVLEDEVQRTSEVLEKNMEALAKQEVRLDALNKTLKETELERDQAVQKASVLDNKAHEAASSKIEIQEKVAALHDRLAKVQATTAVEGSEKEEVEE